MAFFSAFAAFPLNTVWDAFGERNGCASRAELRNKITRYKLKNRVQADPSETVGCIILTDPFFFDDNDMIPLPPDWDDHTVTGKFYSAEEGVGRVIWDSVLEQLKARDFFARPIMEIPRIPASSNEPEWREISARVRVGQGAFRLLVTEAYSRACAITGDHTLPVLEAAHIRPYSESGPHLVSNGLLLRADLHRLFDDGYITVTPDYRVEVSPAIREEFHNGRIYYDLHGKKLSTFPLKFNDYPAKEFLIWHNEKIFKAS